MAENNNTQSTRGRSQGSSGFDNEIESSTTRNYGGSNTGGSNRGNTEGGKYNHLYNMIDAFIDNINMPRNRCRAIKFGVRALGELFLNEEESRSGGSQSSRSEIGGSKKNKKNKNSESSTGSKMRRG